jgi:HK97 family phage prohead protease
MGYDDLNQWKTAAQQGQPPDKPTLLKEYVPDQIKAEGDGKYTFTISTGAVDRDRDTVSVDGWNLDNYRKNPVVLWAHDYSSLPVGRAETIIARNGQLVARMEFVPKEISPFAEAVRQLVEGGWVKATSVGFRPTEWTINEDRGGFDFKRQELLEFSIVPVPSNPEALIQASAAGVDITPIKAWAEGVLKGMPQPEQTVTGAPEPAAAPHASEPPAHEAGPVLPTKEPDPLVEKAGRVLSSANEGRIRSARDLLDECLSSVGVDTEDDSAEKATREPRLVVIRPSEPRKFHINPESVAQAVRTSVQAEVRRLRGRLD